MGPLHSSKTPKTAYKETKDQWFLWFKSRNLHSLAFIMKKIPTLKIGLVVLIASPRKALGGVGVLIFSLLLLWNLGLLKRAHGRC